MTEEGAAREIAQRVARCIDPDGMPGVESFDALMAPYAAAARAVKLDAQMLHTRLVVPGASLGRAKGLALPGLARRSSKFQHLIASLAVPSVQGGYVQRSLAGAKAHLAPDPAP